MAARHSTLPFLPVPRASCEISGLFHSLSPLLLKTKIMRSQITQAPVSPQDIFFHEQNTARGWKVEQTYTHMGDSSSFLTCPVMGGDEDADGPMQPSMLDKMM